MPLLNTLSASEQAAAQLRAEIERGHRHGAMPGVNRLSKELGINRKTVESALRQLEQSGQLLNQGAGRKRLIVPPRRNAARAMRVALLLYEPDDRQTDYIVGLQYALAEAGHAVVVAPKSLTELNMDLARVKRLVKRTPADAWIVTVGSRPVLEWFSAQAVPAMALFGRREGVSIAATGPDKPPAYAAATRQLLNLGHRRIVLVTRRVRRLPELGRSERAFVDELAAHGVAVSNYHLPDWEETREGLQNLLVSLFQVTPPTALIIDEAPYFIATQQFLAGRGLRVPEQVSLICTDADPAFAWCTPAISHIHWDSEPIIQRIVAWARNVSRGRKDVRQTLREAKFIEGGTTGPANVEIEIPKSR